MRKTTEVLSGSFNLLRSQKVRHPNTSAVEFLLLLFLSFSCYVRLFCRPTDCSPPGSSVRGILQARILERAAISFSRGPPRPGIEAASGALAGRFFTAEPSGKPGRILKILVLGTIYACKDQNTEQYCLETFCLLQ